MESTLKFIKDNFYNIDVHKNVKINDYFTANYVITQNGIIKSVFVQFKNVPENLSSNERDSFYHSHGTTDGITFYFANDKIYRNIPGLKFIDIEEVADEDVIFNHFSKEIFKNNNVIFNEEIKNCLIELESLQRFAIDKFQGNDNLGSLINQLKIKYTDNIKLQSFLHNIKYERSDNKIGEIWISLDSNNLSINFKEECNKEYKYSFDLNFTGKNPYLTPQMVIKDCMDYKERFKNTDYLISIFY